MGLLKKAEKVEYVTKADFDALSVRLEAFRTVTAIAVAALGAAMKAAPGLPAADARSRLIKLGAAVDLDPLERAELQGLLGSLGQMDKVEARREHAEEQARARPPTFDTMRIPSWRG